MTWYPAPETNSEFKPENRWLEYNRFLLGRPIFSAMLVSGSVSEVVIFRTSLKFSWFAMLFLSWGFPNIAEQFLVGPGRNWSGYQGAVLCGISCYKFINTCIYEIQKEQLLHIIYIYIHTLYVLYIHAHICNWLIYFSMLFDPEVPKTHNNYLTGTAGSPIDRYWKCQTKQALRKRWRWSTEFEKCERYKVGPLPTMSGVTTLFIEVITPQKKHCVFGPTGSNRRDVFGVHCFGGTLL